MLEILIIDDDLDLTALLKVYLESDQSINVDIANSFATGSAALKECKHDVYIIDYELGGINTGLELIQEAHALELAPLIMLSSINDDRLAEAAIEYGGCDFISKINLNMDHFQRAIQNNIRRAERINTLKNERNSLIQKSYYDALTGLLNRTYLYEKLSLPQINETDSYSSILFLDLDGFKFINDEYGHAAGDEVLKQVAERLIQSVQEQDTVARLGGDEFLIIMRPNINKSSNDIITSIISSRIIRTIASPFDIHIDESNINVKLSITTSIGIALYPDHSTDLNELIKLADQSMYTAKSLGKNQFAIHSPKQTQTIVKREMTAKNGVHN